MPLEKFDEKNHVASYQCEECGEDYATETEALECEESHEEEEHRH